MPAHQYRPDIDGLRGIAVVAVVLYHTGLAGARGGFVGVDVFFAVSGFLITQFIQERLAEGKFSIIEFYERRARRILPALFAVLVFACATACVLLTPSDLRDFSESLSATIAFSSNLLFWKQSGYFAGPAHMKPLLHTWSLAIEEQFYLLYPVLLLTITNWARRSRILLFATLGAASFTLNIWGSTHFPQATFFLLPARAWELLLGALLALDAFPQLRNKKLGDFLSVMGLAGVLGSIFVFSADNPFPGWRAAFPCVGTALLIYSNTPAPTVIGRVLGLRWLVGIGLISYSLYLWHWPVLVFTRYVLFRPLTKLEAATVALVSFAAAVASWKLVEQPFRRPSGVFSSTGLFVASGAAAALLLALSLAGYAKNGFPQRMPEQVARYDASKFDINPYQQRCLFQMSAKRVSQDDFCVLGPNQKPQFVIWGDSHADAVMPAFKVLADEAGVMGWFASDISCQPLLDVRRTYAIQDHQCGDFNRAMLAAIERNNIRSVVLVARWNVSAFGRSSYELDNGLGQVFIVDDQSHEASMEENKHVFERGLRRTLARLAGGGRRIYVLLDVPNTNISTPEFLARGAKAGTIGSRATIDASQYFDQQRFIRSLFDSLSKEYPVQIIDPAKILCEGPQCLIAVDGRSLYKDDHHLSVFGALQLKDLLRPIFDQLRRETIDTRALPARAEEKIN